MLDPFEEMILFLRVAQAYKNRLQMSDRDRALVLAGTCAHVMQMPSVAEFCRQLVLQNNQGHMLRKYDSYAHAVEDSDFGVFLKQVRRKLSPERAEAQLIELDYHCDVRQSDYEQAMPFLEKSKAAAIVVISSTAGVETFMGPAPYNAIKGALIVHAKQLSQALAPAGIRVNCVSPGPVYIEGGAWEFIKNNMADLYNSTLAQIPQGRMGTAQEIANAVAFLASPAASLITGVNLVADGGFTKRVQL